MRFALAVHFAQWKRRHDGRPVGPLRHRVGQARRVGAAKAKGTWEISYTYQDLERDAVFGLWTDSDFGGGGTDTRGHVIRSAYALSDRTNMALAYFINQIGDNAGTETDYNRLQLDVNFKY